MPKRKSSGTWCPASTRERPGAGQQPRPRGPRPPGARTAVARAVDHAHPRAVLPGGQHGPRSQQIVQAPGQGRAVGVWGIGHAPAQAAGAVEEARTVRRALRRPRPRAWPATGSRATLVVKGHKGRHEHHLSRSAETARPAGAGPCAPPWTTPPAPAPGGEPGRKPASSRPRRAPRNPACATGAETAARIRPSRKRRPRGFTPVPRANGPRPDPQRPYARAPCRPRSGPHAGRRAAAPCPRAPRADGWPERAPRAP